MNIDTNVPAGEIGIWAVVIRADGRVENRGLVSYYSDNPSLNLRTNLKIKLRAWRWVLWEFFRRLR